MQITLKKALALRKQADAALVAFNRKRKSYDLELQISIYSKEAREDPDVPADRRLEVVKRDIEGMIALSGALAELRRLVARANESTAMEAILSEAAHLQRIVGLLSPLADATELRRARAELAEELGMNHELVASKVSHGYSPPPSEVRTPLVTEAVRQEARDRVRDLRGRLLELEDQRAAANLTNKITLSEEHVLVFRDHGLL